MIIEMGKTQLSPLYLVLNCNLDVKLNAEWVYEFRGVDCRCTRLYEGMGAESGHLS